MTEYWVSTPKYYCKYCNIYIADNKHVVSKHNSSENHNYKIKLYHQNKNKQKLHGAESEADLHRQLQEIEQAAYLAMTNDNPSSVTTLKKPEISFRFNNNHNQRSQHSNNNSSSTSSTSTTQSNSLPHSFPATGKQLSQKSMDQIADNLRDESKPSGIYTIRGVTYLEGQYHEDRLLTGTKCEVFVEAEDDWCSGEIVARHLIPVPHTEIVHKLYDVKYTSQTNNSEEMTETKIKSDKIRLIRPVTVSESTGLGMWQTVSTRIINEEEEYEKERQREAEAEAEKERLKAELKTENDRLLADIQGEEDALSSFDPYNTGVYRGVTISGSSSNQVNELESLTEGKEVQFKKRKESSNNKERNKGRNTRKKISDE